MTALTPTTPVAVIDQIDPRLAFLERAAARLLLVRACLMDIEEAFDGLVGSLSCRCSREMVELWERNYPAPRLRNRRAG